MRTASAWVLLSTAALIGCRGGTRSAGPVASDPGSATVSIAKVNYEGLDQAVKSHRGQVVMIDVWFRT